MPFAIQSGSEKNKQRARDWRTKNKEHCKKYHQEWHRKNPGYYKTQYKIRSRKRAISDTLRTRIRDVLKGKHKSAPTLELLGCPVVWLEVHLESLFKPGMTWENRGSVWHIDHIKPCFTFDLSKSEQQRACCHWTNLQPLFAEENIKKGKNA